MTRRTLSRRRRHAASCIEGLENRRLLAVVTITTADPDASESGDLATFTMSRDQTDGTSLTVYYTLSGTALNSEDYYGLTGRSMFSRTATSATITVRPIDDALPEGMENVVVTLLPTLTYEVGAASSVTLNLADNDDAIAPITTAALSGTAGNNGWFTSSVTVNLSALDDANGAGINHLSYSAVGAQPVSLTDVPGSTASLLITAEGTTTLTFYATDNAGNIEAAQTLSINIDTTAPVISAWRDMAANADGWNNTDVLSSYTASDSGSGLADPATGSFTFTADGAAQSHTFTVMDLAGNTASVTIDDVNMDKTAPTLILSPDSGPVAPDTLFTWSVGDFSGLDSMTVTLDGQLVSTDPSGSLAIPLGTHSFVVSATDLAGNTSTDTREYTIAPAPTTPPVLDTGIVGNDLVIFATNGDDSIFINAADPHNVRITGLDTAGPYSLGEGGRVIVHALAGNDMIFIAGRVSVEFHGGDGNDTLIGGPRNDLLFGDDGNDHLAGASGHDALVGGNGADRLVGASGNDILVGGNLADVDLRSALAAWSTRPIATFSLPATDDNARDILTGGSGDDYMLTGSSDRITGPRVARAFARGKALGLYKLLKPA